MNNGPFKPLSDFAKAKGSKLGQALREQLHPLINDKGVIAVQVAFLYEGDQQLLGGSLNLATSPGAGAVLDQIVQARASGALPTDFKASFIHLQQKKN